MAVAAGNMSRLQGMLLVVVVALLAALVQLPTAAAGTRYTVSWNYPYSRASFANWNKGTSYVVGDSIRKSRPLQSTHTYLSFVMQSQKVSACCLQLPAILQSTSRRKCSSDLCNAWVWLGIDCLCDCGRTDQEFVCVYLCDVLCVAEFVYNAEAHNVVRVNKRQYDSCDSAGAVTHTDGATVFNLGRPGRYFFICSIPGHCGAGMKLALQVIWVYACCLYWWNRQRVYSTSCIWSAAKSVYLLICRRRTFCFCLYLQVVFSSLFVYWGGLEADHPGNSSWTRVME